MIMIARIPFIFASRIADSHGAGSDSPLRQLPFNTCAHRSEERARGRADSITANWRAVDTAIPTTDPNIRSMFRVEVATARSAGFASSCNATRAVGM